MPKDAVSNLKKTAGGRDQMTLTLQSFSVRGTMTSVPGSDALTFIVSS